MRVFTHHPERMRAFDVLTCPPTLSERRPRRGRTAVAVELVGRERTVEAGNERAHVGRHLVRIRDRQLLARQILKLQAVAQVLIDPVLLAETERSRIGPAQGSCDA